MRYRVQSDRMAWPQGSTISADDLQGCNIVALVEGGHLEPAEATGAVPDEPKNIGKRTPVDPVPDDTADKPEE